MIRRALLGMVASLLIASTQSIANDTQNFTPGLIKAELAAGKTVFVSYASDWCITCLRQERVLKQLRSSNSQYDEKITYIRVDWNDYADAEVTISRKVTRRSTLLLLQGDKEIGRNVAGTNKAVIKALLDMAF